MCSAFLGVERSADVPICASKKEVKNCFQGPIGPRQFQHAAATMTSLSDSCVLVLNVSELQNAILVAYVGQRTSVSDMRAYKKGLLCVF